MNALVLIVEDDHLNMKLFRDLLHSGGYSILQAHSGAEALHLLDMCRPDLITLDVRLPDMSGLDVAKFAKDHPDHRNVPVLAVTAQAMVGDEARIRASGCDDYLSKPIQVHEFLQTVARLLGKG
jgi:two-component system, cell cycle response regulator DivK